MAAPSKFDSVVTNPGGTGSNITPTLSTHAAGDVLEIWVTKTGNAAWSAPAGWIIARQVISPGNATSATVGTLLKRVVLAGDTLPLPSPVCNLAATVTRHAICRTVRGADIEGVYTLPEWILASTSGTSNPIRPPSVTTPAPEMFVTHYYCQRLATNAPEPTDYTQDQQVITSGTLVTNISERTVSDQATVLSNQDASPTSGGRWAGMISCAPSPDYPYYRSGSQAFSANGTSVTPALPTGTTTSDNRGNKDVVILTAQCAGVAPTLNTPGDWTVIDEWSNTTSGGATTVRKWRALYTGTLDRQVNRTPSGEIFAYLSTYHNANQLIPIGSSAVQQNASSTTATFPSLPRTGTKVTVQATCVADATPTFTAPSGWIERNDSQGVTCADQVFNAIGTTASASFTLNSASPTLTGLMEVFSVASVINLILTPATETFTLTIFAPAVVVGVDVTVTPDAISLTLTTVAPIIIVDLPFPATGELDNFNRADGALGANWGGNLFEADGTLAIDTNAVRGDSPTVNNNQGWVGQFGPDCEVWVQILSGTSDDFSTFIAARWSVLGTDTPDGYAVRARGGATNNLFLIRFDSGALTGLVVIPQEVDDGDWLGLRAVGDRLDVYFKDASGSNLWQWVGGATDATYLAAGHIGLLLTSNTIKSDNFGGGTLGSVIVEPGPVVLTLSGFAPLLQLVATPASESLSLTTFAPTISISEVATPTSVSLTITTFAPSLQLLVAPAPATLTLSTFSPQLRESPTPASASFVLTTPAPMLRFSVTPTTALLNTTTFTPQPRESITPSATTLALTTFAPSVIVIVTVTPATALLALTTLAPTVVASVTVIPTSAALTLTTFPPNLLVVTTPAAASLQLSTSAPLVTTNTILTPASSSLVLTGFALALHETTTPGASSLLLTTFAPSVVLGDNVTVEPASASLTIDRFSPSLVITVTPTNQPLVLTTFAPAIRLGVTPNALLLTLTGFVPALHEAVTPITTGLTLSAFSPFVTAGNGVTVEPGTGTFEISGFAPQLVFGIVPPTRSVTIETFAPTLQESVFPDPTSLVVTSFGPLLQFSVQPLPGVFSLLTFAPSVGGDETVTPTTLNLTLTAFAPNISATVTEGSRVIAVSTFAFPKLVKGEFAVTTLKGTTF